MSPARRSRGSNRPRRPFRPRGPLAPLAGRRIVVTRAADQAGELVEALEALGAAVLAAPTIRIVPLADLSALEAALRRLPEYAWLVFTSRNAVDVVCGALAAWGLAPRDLARASIAAIGPRTALALASYGLAPALVPDEFVAEAVVRAFARLGGLAGARVLLPRARGARDTLPEGLRVLGALVDEIPIYETVRPPGDGGALAREILAGKIAAITFTSSSTVRHFVDLVGPSAATSGRFAAAVIGPVTAHTAQELGIPVAVQAASYTVAGLVDALVQHFARDQP